MRPAVLFGQAKWSDSPYINHFLSADTIGPGYANPQNLNRYSYVTNNPLRYTDPTGHKPCEEEEGACLSENQVTKKHQAELQKARNKSHRSGHNSHSDFFSEIAYFADNVGAITSYAEAIVVDTIGALVIADGCVTVVGCPSALGYAGAIDIGVSMYSPLGLIENMAGGVAAGATAISDFINGTSYIRLADDGGIDIGIGRDTVVSAMLGGLGQIPEANFDAVVSGAQLEYDNRRRSGDLAAATLFQFHIPGSPNLWGNGNGWPNGAPW